MKYDIIPFYILSGKCPSELLAVENTRSDNGIDVPGITHPDSCKEWCLGKLKLLMNCTIKVVFCK